MAQMKVGIPKVVLHDGVVWYHSESSFQFRQRLLIPALFEKSPSKTINKIAIVRLEHQRPLDNINRFVESNAAFSVHVSQVIERTGMLGIEVDGTLHLGYRGLEIPKFFIDHTQVKMVGGVVIVERNGFLQAGSSLAVGFVFGLRQPQVKLRASVPWVQFYRLGERRNRLRQIAQTFIDMPKVQV